MATPKRNLQVLNVNRCGAIQDEKKRIMDICSEGCVYVEELSYSGAEPPLDVFNKFFEKNKPSLSSLFFDIIDVGECKYANLLAIIQALQKHSCVGIDPRIY